MKKILTLLFALHVTVFAFAFDFIYWQEKDIPDLGLSRDTFECTKLGGDSISITKVGSDALNNIIIVPSSVKEGGQTYRVTAIGDSAFYKAVHLRSRITQVTLPVSLKYIGACAFFAYTALKTINIPDSVLTMGNKVFSKCGALQDIAIPKGITTIPNYAFSQCTKLKTVTLPQNVKIIEQSAFTECSSLKKIDFPSSLSTLSHYAFSSCSALDSVVIPDKVTELYVGVFSGCSKLKNVQLSANLKNCYSSVFHGCPLKSLYIPDKMSYFNGGVVMCDSLDVVYCAAITPPTWKDESSFYFHSTADTQVDTLYVPFKSVNTYKAHNYWSMRFANIMGHMFGETDVADITSTTANLMWKADSAVLQYEINIYTNSTPFAQYLVDSDGHLLSSQRFTPSIIRMPMDSIVSTNDYFVISISNMTAGTNYTYTIEGKDENDELIYHEEGAFTTLSKTTGIDTPLADDPRKQATKLFRNGQLIIIRNGKTYNAVGARVE